MACDTLIRSLATPIAFLSVEPSLECPQRSVSRWMDGLRGRGGGKGGGGYEGLVHDRSPRRRQTGPFRGRQGPVRGRYIFSKMGLMRPFEKLFVNYENI